MTDAREEARLCYSNEIYGGYELTSPTMCGFFREEDTPLLRIYTPGISELIQFRFGAGYGGL